MNKSIRRGVKSGSGPRTERKARLLLWLTFAGIGVLSGTVSGCVIASDGAPVTSLAPLATTALQSKDGAWVHGLNIVIREARDGSEAGPDRRRAIGVALQSYLVANPSHIGDRLRSLFGRDLGPGTSVLDLSGRIRDLARDGWLLDLKSLEGEGDFLLPVVEEPLDIAATRKALDRVFSPDTPDYVAPVFVDAKKTEPAYSLGDLAVVNLSNSRDRVLLFRDTGDASRQHFESNAYKLITESSVVNEVAHATLIRDYDFDIVGTADVPEQIRKLQPENHYDALQVHQFISDAASLSATRHAIWMMVHHMLAVSTESATDSINRSNYQLSTVVFRDGIDEVARKRGLTVDVDDWTSNVRRKVAAVGASERQGEFERLVGVYSAQLADAIGADGIDELRIRHINAARDMLELIRQREGGAPSNGTGTSSKVAKGFQ